jgi:hypothetical protein
MYESLMDELEYAKGLPENEREEFLRPWRTLFELRRILLCHCPDRPWTLFSSTPQPPDLQWHDKHDR